MTFDFGFQVELRVVRICIGCVCQWSIRRPVRNPMHDSVQIHDRRSLLAVANYAFKAGPMWTHVKVSCATSNLQCVAIFHYILLHFSRWLWWSIDVRWLGGQWAIHASGFGVFWATHMWRVKFPRCIHAYIGLYGLDSGQYETVIFFQILYILIHP